MFSSAELIEALNRRLRRSIRPVPPAGLPPAWQAWFAQMQGRAGPDGSARAEAMVAEMAGRGPRVRPPAELLAGWSAFRALWRQQWEPPMRDERGLRVFSRVASFSLHLLLAVALSWLMHARFVLAPASDAQRGEHVIEVEFIGRGTPEENGGGRPDVLEVAEEVPVEQKASPPVPADAPSDAGSLQSAVAEREPGPEPPDPVRPVVEQPLEVTETTQPDGPFQLPPVPPVEIAPVPRREAEVAPRARDIELVQIQELEAPRVQPDRPELAPPEVEVVEREVGMLPRDVEAPAVPAPEPAAPELRPPTRPARIREIPMPQEADAGATAASEVPAQPDPGPEVVDSGAGPAPVPEDGGWATPERNDDWGSSGRERPGGQRGTSSLFNPDGSPRLPPGSGSVGGGLPPGTITEDYEKIDRMGTWLKRPPTDYEPTGFDRFWVPHESLLQEWVRRSVRTVLIPIPGTGKAIRCDVVTLAVAGGCGIVDPDLQDEPAGARPPPDIPFKPELHEDQEGLGEGVRGSRDDRAGAPGPIMGAAPAAARMPPGQ